jgi:hypothetical protein
LGLVNGDILNSGRRLCNLGSILIHPKQIANDRFAFKDLLNRCKWDTRTAREVLTVSGRLRATGFELVSTYSVLRCPLRSRRLYFKVVLRASVRHTEASSTRLCASVDPTDARLPDLVRRQFVGTTRRLWNFFRAGSEHSHRECPSGTGHSPRPSLRSPAAGSDKVTFVTRVCRFGWRRRWRIGSYEALPKPRFRPVFQQIPEVLAEPLSLECSEGVRNLHHDESGQVLGKLLRFRLKKLLCSSRFEHYGFLTASETWNYDTKWASCWTSPFFFPESELSTRPANKEGTTRLIPSSARDPRIPPFRRREPVGSPRE